MTVTNPKHVLIFQSEESSSSPKPTPAQPPHLPAAAPAPQPVPPISKSSLTQEQLIRQQLLAKQKQLLELQQKKIELELEQTKAQLVRPTRLVMNRNLSNIHVANSYIFNHQLCHCRPVDSRYRR